LIVAILASFFGLYVDNKFTWKNHIEHVCTKLTANIYLLRRLSDYLPTEILKSIYFGVIYPYLSYGPLLWGSACGSNVKRVFVLQQMAIRTVVKLNRKHSCKDLFKHHNILTLYAMFVYQIINLVKEDNEFTVRNEEIHNYYTGSKENVHRVSRRLKATSRSPYIQGTIFYNKLPASIKKLEGKQFSTTSYY